MKLSKTLLAATAALMISPGVALADSMSITVGVEATVPVADGLQVDAVGDWEGTNLTMGWDIDNADLKPISKQLDIINKSGGVQAYLADPAVLASDSSLATIPMTVTVNGKELKAGSAATVEILNATEAASVKRVGMIIKATKPTAPAVYAPGSYVGNVTMVFDGVPTTPGP